MSIESNSEFDQIARGSREDSPSPGEHPASVAPGAEGEFPLEWTPTTLAGLCPVALAQLGGQARAAVEYTPDPEHEGTGEWDARRLAYAITILAEDAVMRTAGEGRVSLRWREHDDEVVLRVQFPRPLARGDRFVTYFEEGVRPDGADDEVGTLRLVVARKIVLQHGGSLARVRTRGGTTYVVTLPRGGAGATVREEREPS